MGSSQETLSIPVKLHQGGSDTEASLPGRGQATKEFTSKKPISSVTDMHISREGQRYHNPNPLSQLIGPANEATIIIEGQQFLALINSGAQLSMMLESLVQALKLSIHKLNALIEAEVSDGGVIPYTGYIEARLTIPGIKQMDKDSLFMVTNDSPYAQWVPIQLGTLHIREAIQLASEEEKQSLTPAWVTASLLHGLCQRKEY